MATRECVFIGYECGYDESGHHGWCVNYFNLCVVGYDHDRAFARLKKIAYKNNDIEIEEDVTDMESWCIILEEVESKPYLGCAFNYGLDGSVELKTFDTTKELAQWLYERMLANRQYAHNFVVKCARMLIDGCVNRFLDEVTMNVPGDRYPRDNSLCWFELNIMNVVGEWRPHKAREYPRPYQDAMRTLVLLAKTV